MKTIALQEETINGLKSIKLSKNVFNIESHIKLFNYHGELKIIKQLDELEGPKYDNKMYTIDLLDKNRSLFPKSLCVPEALIRVSNINVGFLMPYIVGINLADIINDVKYPLDEIKSYLQGIGKILDQLKLIRENTSLKTFYIADLHSSNFIVNPSTKEITVVDLDSCKIENNTEPFSLYLYPNGLISNVKEKYRIIRESAIVKVDENTDLFCYTCIILSYLYGKNVSHLSLNEYYGYLDYLSSIGIDKNLINSFEKLVTKEDNVNPGPYIQSLTEEQVCLSKKSVYDILKK